MNQQLLHQRQLEVQAKENIDMYNEVVETAFNKCIRHFHTNELSEVEQDCVFKTAQKLIETMQKTSEIFAKNKNIVLQPNTPSK